MRFEERPLGEADRGRDESGDAATGVLAAHRAGRRHFKGEPNSDQRGTRPDSRWIVSLLRIVRVLSEAYAVTHRYMRICILRTPISRMGAGTLADRDAIVKSRMREAGAQLTTFRARG